MNGRVDVFLCTEQDARVRLQQQMLRERSALYIEESDIISIGPPLTGQTYLPSISSTPEGS
jgi:hypothetical protein